MHIASSLSTPADVPATEMLRRSPMEEPSGGRQEHINEEIDHLEDDAEVASSSSSVIRSQDYLAFMTKAVESAYKRNEGPIDDDFYYTGANVMKWVERAEASMIRDNALINKHIQHYTSKLSNRPMTRFKYARAEEKEQEWLKLYDLPLDLEVKDAVLNPDLMFQRDIQGLRTEAVELAEENAPPLIMAMTLRDLHKARADLRLWNDANADRQSLLHRLNQELKAYAEVANDFYYSQDPIASAKAVDHAIKAVIWSRRAREVQVGAMRRAQGGAVAPAAK